MLNDRGGITTNGYLGNCDAILQWPPANIYGKGAMNTVNKVMDRHADTINKNWTRYLIVWIAQCSKNKVVITIVTRPKCGRKQWPISTTSNEALQVRHLMIIQQEDRSQQKLEWGNFKLYALDKLGRYINSCTGEGWVCFYFSITSTVLLCLVYGYIAWPDQP